MAKHDSPHLRGLWYLAVAGRRLKPGRMLSKQMLGEPILLGRGRDGAVFALRDICPHRGIPLSCGAFDGREVTCCYHGWRFGPDGRCTAIPSLRPDQELQVERIKTKAYPCREVQGHIWVYFGRDGEVGDPSAGTARWAIRPKCHGSRTWASGAPRSRSPSSSPVTRITRSSA
jgi:phenylpropionate dioxygenase-like ring-hydroxylating dioxygenase large terminal subunit